MISQVLMALNYSGLVGDIQTERPKLTGMARLA
jgi:hypothetical protein